MAQPLATVIFKEIKYSKRTIISPITASSSSPLRLAKLLAMATPIFLCATVLLCSFLPVSLCESFVVGGSSGWTIPSSETSLNYEQWASSRTFHVGDSLVFNYAKEVHSVLQVTHQSYHDCDTASPLSTNSDGMTVINLSHKGSYYFICGVPGHCQAGQKIQLRVVDVGGHVETSQAAATDGVAVAAPAPAPSSEAVPPVTASAPPLQHAKIMMMGSIAYTATACLLIHAFSP